MKKKPQFDATYIDDKGLYFTDLEYNYLGFIESKSNHAEIKAIFSDEKVTGKYLFGELIRVNNFLYAIPLAASSMYIIETDKFEVCKKIIIDSNYIYKETADSGKAKFMSAHIYGQSIYLVPTMFPAIVEYSTVTHNAVFYDNWIDDVSKVGRQEEKAFFRKTKLLNGVVYAPLCKSNKLLKFYIDIKKWEIIEIEKGNEGYSDICFDGKQFWLAPRCGNYLTRWNEITGDVQRIEGIWRDSVRFAQIDYFTKTSHTKMVC